MGYIFRPPAKAWQLKFQKDELFDYLMHGRRKWTRKLGTTITLEYNPVVDAVEVYLYRTKIAMIYPDMVQIMPAINNHASQATTWWVQKCITDNGIRGIVGRKRGPLRGGRPRPRGPGKESTMTAMHDIHIRAAEPDWLPSWRDVEQLFDQTVEEKSWADLPAFQKPSRPDEGPVRLVTDPDNWYLTLSFEGKWVSHLHGFAGSLSLKFPGTYVRVHVEWPNEDIPQVFEYEYVAGRKNREWEERLVEIDIETGKVK